MTFTTVGVFLCFVYSRLSGEVNAISVRRGFSMQSQLQNALKNQNSSIQYHSELTITTNKKFTNFTSKKDRNIIIFCDRKQKPKFQLFQGSLLTYMMRLLICQVSTNKTWFEDECRDTTYAYSDYHKAVYLKFCNPNIFELQCKTNLDQTPTTVLFYWINKHHIIWNTTNFDKMVNAKTNESFQTTTSSFPTIHSSHCKAINSFFDSILPHRYNFSDGYSSDNVTMELAMPFYNVQYAEWFLLYTAFCQPSACGISRKDYDSHPITGYECLLSDCKVTIIATIVIDALLAFFIVISNLLVLAVAWRTTVMQNIPGYFKTFLASADLIIGLVVLPGSVYHTVVQKLQPLPVRAEAQMPLVTDYFDQRYLNFVGVFTVWSFSVSLYLLGAASIVHYLAVTRPIKYRQGKYFTKKISIAVYFLFWIIGFAKSIYPIFTTETYTIVVLGFVLSTGLRATIEYAISLGLPLLSVWIINLALLIHVCSEKKDHKKLFETQKRVGVDIKSSRPKPFQGVASANLRGYQLSCLDNAVLENDLQAKDMNSVKQEQAR